MRVTWELRDGALIVYLSGELDHHAAQETLADVGRAIDEHLPLRCALNLSKLQFMDSSGIAVVLGVYRRLREIGGELTVVAVPPQASRVLDMAGVGKIVSIQSVKQGVT